MNYVELQVTTNFSFLRGASHPCEYFVRAYELGIPALGITDRHSLAGIVRSHVAAEETGVRLIVGTRLDLEGDSSYLVYPTNRAAYSRLCRLLTLGKSRAGKGKAILTWDDLSEYGEGQVVIFLADEANDQTKSRLERIAKRFDKNAYMAMSLRRQHNDQLRLWKLHEMALAHQVRPVVTNNVLFHVPERRQLQDVLTCIKEKCTIDALGFKRNRFADRHLKTGAEMERLFKNYPDAIRATIEIANKCRFSLKELKYQYPEERDDTGLSAQQSLENATWSCAQQIYHDAIPLKVRNQLQHELDLIRKLDYAPYFLTVYSIVKFAKTRGILCQGRGSAANSAVCFVLGITAIDPTRNDMLFERFVSQERQEPPDIDVDFEHERREEVIQWIYETYGRSCAAITAVVTRYRSKSAVRDVGKALGLSEDVTAALSKMVWTFSREIISEKDARDLHLNLEDRRLCMTLDLARELYNFPRHLSQHTGGFVLTRDRLDELVPIEPARMDKRQIIEWDKDDIDALKFMKIDVLGLGMLGAMRRCFELIENHKGKSYNLASIPSEDKETYTMICRADTVGVFQIESRAQMSMLPRMKPRTYYDLVIEVAIVRPGPIQGDMVHPYLRRREGREKPDYPTEELKAVLGKTLGVPLFQEQAMNVAIHCAGFTPAEADQLRRAMATFKFTGGVSHFHEKMISGMVKRGYTEEFAERCFKQIEGFGSYGFPESHAASFALLAYGSSWLKCHHADAFCCALLNAQPMGFYAPPQLVRDARAHGVDVRPVDINSSEWESTLEETGTSLFAVRLGFKLVAGLSIKWGSRIAVIRSERPYEDVEDLQERTGLPLSVLELLAKADVFGSLKLSRRKAQWRARGLGEKPLPLLSNAGELYPHEPSVALLPMTSGREVIEDYRYLGLTLRDHPMSFVRDHLKDESFSSAEKLKLLANHSLVKVAGLVLVRQKPASAKGVMFMTLEDETGHINLVIWPSLFEQERRVILSSRLVACQGRVQKAGDVIHVVASTLADRSSLLKEIAQERVNEEQQTPIAKTDQLDFGLKNFC